MFESARLHDDHALEGFDCDKESLNTWLIAHARRARTAAELHTLIVVDAIDDEAQSFYEH